MIRDTADWLRVLEDEGELKRVRAAVDWDGEISEISRRMLAQKGPALLFENIRGYESGWCRKLLTNALGTRGRIALMLGLPTATPHPEIVKFVRQKLREPVAPLTVTGAPAQANVITGDRVKLTEIPVPQWHPLDGGRYINTWCSVVTRDPDTGEHNVGLYRGMITGENRIGVQLIPAQGWGQHYDKYRQMGAPMPVSVVFGGDPCVAFTAAMSVTDTTEYEIIGAIRGEPLPLVKCRTNDLLVPADADLVLEGSISPEAADYEVEGPFGEWSGYYGAARRRPVIRVDAITHRDDPVYRGMIEGARVGVVTESVITNFVLNTALMWQILERQGIPGVIDIALGPVTAIKIHKTYQGQPRHIAAALWGSRLAINMLKTLLVVEEGVDIRSLREQQLAILNFVDPARDVMIVPMNTGSNLDLSLSGEARDELRWGTGLQSKMLIDATIDWATHPVREEWGNGRVPPGCTDSPAEIVALVDRRWTEYDL